MALLVTASPTSVTLAWTASTTVPTTGTITYDVYRNEVQIANGVSGTSYTDSTVQAGQSYSYTVRANMESVDSNAATVTIPGNTPPTTSASFVGTDTTTQGKPKYTLITPTVTGASTYTWATNSSDPRAINKVASCWYSATSFTFTVTGPGNLELYLLDWDNYYGGRKETIQIMDSSGNVLDTQTASSFQQGVWYIWAITGTVTVKIANLTQGNAVLSAVGLN